MALVSQLQHNSLPLVPSSISRRSVSTPCRYRFNNNHCVGYCRSRFKTLGLKHIGRGEVQVTKASTSIFSSSSQGDENIDEALRVSMVNSSNTSRNSFLSKLAIGTGVAATVTLISIFGNWSSQGSAQNLPLFVDSSSQSVPIGFNLTVLGHRIVIPEYTPGWVYFWLLMAAGCGLFISEEALNVWVGITLARTLTLDQNWQAFTASFWKNAPYIVSTVLWVYWGVCISDLIPYYLGRMFRRTKASEDICSKLGIGKEKLERVTQAIQKYGNLIGFVERFSIGLRNPTAFLAGASGITSDCFFAGVCCGGIFTLSIQLAIGFLLRERPAMALAGVATVVGIWTVFPYIIAASTALFLFIRRKPSQS